MRPIPAKMRQEININPYYKKCARKKENACQGRITIEHAIIFGGKQLNELWALLPLCEYHHAVNNFQDGGDLNKELNVYIALEQATDEELKRVSKAIDYIALKARLKDKYNV